MRYQLLNTASAVILLDQLTKYLALQADVITYNPGISFGFAADNAQILIIFVTLGLLIGVWLWQKKLWSRYPVIAGLLFGGGISNLIDRIIFGGVRDWLPVVGFELTNNIADWSITLAIAGLLLLEIKRQRLVPVKKDANAD